MLDLRLDHDPQRQLLQVRELRDDERLRLVNHRGAETRRRAESFRVHSRDDTTPRSREDND